MAQNYLRVKSGELRVEMWCVRRADTFLYGAMIFMAIVPLVVGASIARPRRLPVISYCRDDCNGRSMTAPTPLLLHLSLYGAHLYTLCKHFSTFFVAFQRAKTGDFPRCRAQNACIFLQGLYNKHYVPCARANVVFCRHSVERKERNFRLWMQFPRYVRSWPKSTIRSA